MRGVLAAAMLLAVSAGAASAQTGVRPAAPATPPAAALQRIERPAAPTLESLDARLKAMEAANETQGATILQLQAKVEELRGVAAGYRTCLGLLGAEVLGPATIQAGYLCNKAKEKAAAYPALP